MAKTYNTDRTWSPTFEDYTESIVAHRNYDGLFYERDKNGRIKWVVTGKSKKGKLRQAWWDARCAEHGIQIRKGCYAIIARKIHPTKKHVCQCCGRELSIMYEYPSKRLLSKLHNEFAWNMEPADFTIGELIERASSEPDGLPRMCAILEIPAMTDTQSAITYVYDNLVRNCSSMLSPGVMSNCPDRYDGFHSDGLCCREGTDKGRHSDNMKTYTQDRRAYEEWSDGDYNLANRIMGEFNKQPPMICPVCGKTESMTADHIGPISLGFCHSIHFAPMCKSCNSSKNNRFTKSDVDALLNIERQGGTVISWHSAYIWNAIKNDIATDEDAKWASSVMAKCHQNILNILALVHAVTGEDFLKRYLHPEYSLTDYRFENVDLLNLKKWHIISNPLLDSKNKRKNQNRYLRIAFESLDEFISKKNRKNHFLVDEDCTELKAIIKAIEENDPDLADNLLRSLIKDVSLKILASEKAEKPSSSSENV